MNISDLGEIEVIKRLFNIFSRTGEDHTNLFPYDDCAVIDLGSQYLLVTTDMISRQTHIPVGATGYQIGWFLMAINLSDLAAKGGVPLGFLNALGLPPNIDEDFIEDLGRGIAACGKSYACPVVGGDTKSNVDMTMTGIALGTVPKERFMPRIGCEAGDILAITGELGRVGYAFHKLENMQDMEANAKFRELLLKLIMEIKPRLIAGQMLGKMGGIHASMDLSDSLGVALHQLIELNPIGISLNMDSIPRVPMLKEIEKSLDDDKLEEILLYTGGDYELLVSVDRDQFRVANTALSLIGVQLTAIGTITNSGNLQVKTPTGIKDLENKGFNHFGDID